MADNSRPCNPNVLELGHADRHYNRGTKPLADGTHSPCVGAPAEEVELAIYNWLTDLTTV